MLYLNIWFFVTYTRRYGNPAIESPPQDRGANKHGTGEAMIGRGSSCQQGLDGDSRTGVKHLFVAALPFLLFLGALVVTSTAFADTEGSEGATPQTVLTPQLINEAINSPTMDMGTSETDGQAAQRLPHGELDRSEALDLLTSRIWR